MHIPHILPRHIRFYGQKIKIAQKLARKISALAGMHRPGMYHHGMNHHGMNHHDMNHHGMHRLGDILALLFFCLGLWFVPGQANALSQSHAVLKTDSSSVLGNYLIADYARREYAFDQTINAYHKALQIAPETPQIMREYLDMLAILGRYDHALPIARKALQAGFSYRAALITIYAHAMQNQNYASALQQTENAQWRQLSSLEGKVMRCWALVGNGRYAEARNLAANFGAQKYTQDLGQYVTALIALLAGDHEQTENLFAEILAQNDHAMRDQAILAYVGYLQKQGQEEKVTILLRSLQQASLEVFRAAADTAIYQEKLVVATKFAPIDNPLAGLAHTIQNIALLIAQSRNPQHASEYLHLARYLLPAMASNYLYLAELADDVGNFALAENLYAQIKPDHYLYRTAQLRIARMINSQERSEEAISLLRQLHRREPRNGDAIRVIGDIFRGQEKFIQAAQAYEESFTLLGPIKPEHWALYYLRGITYERSHRFPLAQKDFLTALSLKKDQPLVLNYLGYSWLDQGVHLQKALDMVHKAALLRPKDGYIADSVGWGYYRLANYPEAVRYLEQAILLTPGDATINDHLGDAYWRSGRDREAKFQWDHALTFLEDESKRKLIERKIEIGLDQAEEELAKSSGATEISDNTP